ncbi:hypothetical protein H4R26_004486 [Coemansia thaxteri]|uniref:Uncharacterized protein n=1 Tax=Coemansia thaxteri TaxID=2663907 RepID=A0A9W8BAW6_9FUNG|nr:hypothetical protein H4R26_004486 [Coemansia thaxteri]
MAAVADISLGQELYMKMQSESTISYLLGPRDAPAYSRPYSSSEATVRGVFGVLGEESRLSAKTTLVASEAVPVAAAVEHGKIRWRPTQRTATNSAAACGGGIACLSGKMNRSSSTSSTKAVATGFGANAIDGSLSLSIRPAGWTLKLLGPSMRRLGAGTGGCVDLHRSRATNKASWE